MSVSREKLYQEVWAEPMLKVGAHYGVSSSFLARVCRRMNVPCPPRGYWARKSAGLRSKVPPLPNPEPGDELAWIPGGGDVPRQPYPSPSTRKARGAILQGLLKGLADDAAIKEAVAMTTGLSPADLVQLVDRLKQAAAGSAEGISSTQLTAALFDLRRGEVDSSRQLNPVAKRRVAYHEAGHALLAYHLLGPGSVEHLTVIPAASGGLGAAYMHQSESLDLPDADFIQRRLAVLLAGRVAEALSYPDGGPSCGAENDIKEATSMAQLAVGTWGLDVDFPMVSLEALSPSLQQVLAPRLLERIQAWLKAAEAQALEELIRHQASLKILVQHLITAETLHRTEILTILATGNPSSDEVKSEDSSHCS
jgi:ATP-dependent Zn protease